MDFVSFLLSSSSVQSPAKNKNLLNIRLCCIYSADAEVVCAHLASFESLFFRASSDPNNLVRSEKLPRLLVAFNCDDFVSSCALDFECGKSMISLTHVILSNVHAFTANIHSNVDVIVDEQRHTGLFRHGM